MSDRRLPDAKGWYLTADHARLLRYDGYTWTAYTTDGDETELNDGYSTTADPDLLIRTLGAHRLPLTRLDLAAHAQKENHRKETGERTLPMTDMHYAVSIRRIYDAHTDMLKGYRLILWEIQEIAPIAVAGRDYPTGMLEPIPQQTLDDADALARIFKCKNYRKDEKEMWE